MESSGRVLAPGAGGWLRPCFWLELPWVPLCQHSIGEFSTSYWDHNAPPEPTSIPQWKQVWSLRNTRVSGALFAGAKVCRMSSMLSCSTAVLPPTLVNSTVSPLSVLPGFSSFPTATPHFGTERGNQRPGSVHMSEWGLHMPLGCPDCPVLLLGSKVVGKLMLPKMLPQWVLQEVKPGPGRELR